MKRRCTIHECTEIAIILNNNNNMHPPENNIPLNYSKSNKTFPFRLYTSSNKKKVFFLNF